MKTAKLTLNGVDYTMCFSLRVARDCADKFGGLEQMQEAMQSKKTAEVLDTCIWMIAAMMDAGARYDRKCGVETPEPMTIDDLYDATDINDLAGLKSKIFETISNGQKSDIRVESKNAAANPGDN